MTLEELNERAEAIRMPKGWLARAARLNKTTVSRTLCKRTDPRGSTIRSLEVALRAEELRLLDHLLKLHPLTARREDAA